MTAQTQIETLSAIARQCLDECDGDKGKAAIAVDTLLKSNLDLRAIVAAEAVGKLSVETKAHAHNRASRHVAKEALKRLYLAWNKTAYVDGNLTTEASQ